jgi:hypothetical protein
MINGVTWIWVFSPFYFFPLLFGLAFVILGNLFYIIACSLNIFTGFLLIYFLLK